MMRFLTPLVVLVVVAVISYFVAKKTHYECPQCGDHFQVSAANDIFKPHFMGQRNETCPSCGFSGLMSRHEGKS